MALFCLSQIAPIQRFVLAIIFAQHERHRGLGHFTAQIERVRSFHLLRRRVCILRAPKARVHQPFEYQERIALGELVYARTQEARGAGALVRIGEVRARRAELLAAAEVEDRTGSPLELRAYPQAR